jgi:hypothetical protein
MSKFSKFIKDIVLPDVVDKERRKKILSEGIIETWQSEEQERKAKEAKEIAKETYKKARSSKDDKEHSHPTEHDESDDLEMVKAIIEKEKEKMRQKKNKV